MKIDFLKTLNKIRRGPAIMLQKDIGVILANTSIDKNSRVLDAGSGCGILTSNLARFVKRVYSYDNRKEFLEAAKDNSKKFGLKNITFRNKDVYEEIKEKNLDLITLDLREPWRALKNAYNALRKDGMLVCFSPHITQTNKVIEEAKNDFKLVNIKEIIERDWVVENKRMRPEHTGILHTGFIIFLRKI
ncbi:MAG: methyltransferase domain-containing protein [Nanoarchaeota archaeon]|nr:methyltransferase domain-containing protein [Nanoarchaeota archaeon]